ncbi:hypothetical protein FIBSPDRAFT_1042838 [Athelia psychrophila]|uniref:Uncharacterized protein n=1 Tax=Athelia psychrophila TaxID=1759441 RepID=A0A166M6Q0_9AGAM|nr:hypothetical protein FIBSPDRAFT_1042838 [Fibularhizoctonia sp. CBS 109695]
MTSYNTVLHPTRASNVTNVNGDHLTFHCARDIIILHFHAPGPSTPPDRDHTDASATGASPAAGDESGTLPRAAQDANVAQAPRSVLRRFLRVFGL